MKRFLSLALLGLMLTSAQCFGQEGNIIYADDIDEFSKQASAIALEEANNRLAEERRQATVERMLDFFIQNEIPQDVLGLVDDQLDKIKVLKNEYDASMNRLMNASYEGMTHSERDAEVLKNENEFIRARHDFTNRLSKILLDHQVDIINSFDVHTVGVPKVITESEIAEVLQLTDKQKEAIRARSDKIAMKIHDFVHDIRKESFDAIIGELSDEQIKKLKELYGDDYIREYFRSNNLPLMFQHHLYDEENLPKDAQSSPVQALRWTDVWSRRK